MWTVTDETLKKHNLQDVIDCAKTNDTVLLETTTIIQPPDQIVVKKNLTIRGAVKSEARVVLTCSESNRLFLFK